MIKLNLGSGQRPFGEGWLNIDIREQGYKVDLISDIGSLPMFNDNSVDVICLHHVIEHIDIGELEGYITEWYRLLKPGGELSVFVPDISRIFAAWGQGRINTYIRNVNIYGAYQGYLSDLHRWGYDSAELIDRISCVNPETKQPKFNWSMISSWNPDMINLPLYQGADIAWDWYILGKVFVK